MSQPPTAQSLDHGPAARAGERALHTLSALYRWIAQTADPDLPPPPHVSGRTLRDVAQSLRRHATDLEHIADRLDPTAR